MDDNGFEDAIEIDGILYDCEGTRRDFGYDPRDRKPQSHKKIYAICQNCGNIWLVRFDHSKKICNPCGYKNGAWKRTILQSTGRELPSHIDRKKTIICFGYDPIITPPKSNRLVVGHCIICGVERIKEKVHLMQTEMCRDCRMRSENTRRKMSIAQKGKYSGKNNPMYGKPSPYSKGEWYYRQDDGKVFLRSSYEKLVAEYLDREKISWEYESTSFPVTYIFMNQTKDSNYWPDFYLPEVNEYWEVKGWFRNEARIKWNAVLKQHPEIKFVLKDQPALKEMGIL